MAVLCKLSRFAKRSRIFEKNVFSESFRNVKSDCISKNMCTIVRETKQTKGVLKFSLIGAGIGVLIGAGYAYHKKNQTQKNLFLEGTEQEIKILKYKPSFTPSRQIISPVDPTGLKLTLFQYQTCPFCCKVRVLLDYYGLSYDIVEVDPVLRKEINWSTYKKVPILLGKINGGYQPLTDSSMIISLLTSHLTDKSHDIEELVKYYPSILINDENNNLKNEIVNKYFLMYQKGIPNGKTMNDIVEERMWRKWSDDVLVHALSPNVYRSLREAYQTFNWFSEVGRWEEYFPTWERLIMINIGACAMWLISKRLKKKHGLKEDVRESLYDEVNHWLKAIKARGSTFMGGQNPDLSDLAVYGILKSIEGCAAFKDLLENTNLDTWYSAMSEKIEQHAGSIILHQ